MIYAASARMFSTRFEAHRDCLLLPFRFAMGRALSLGVKQELNKEVRSEDLAFFDAIVLATGYQLVIAAVERVTVPL